MRRGALVSAAALAAVLIGGAGALARPAAPFELMRDLQTLHDQAAAGSTAALEAQPQLIDSLAERFLAADPSVWRTRKNAQAVASYLFSGGRPKVGHALIERNVLPKEDENLVKGALAYAEGNDALAKTLLLPLDAATLPPAHGAHLALVQATLTAKDDQPKAIRLLDFARLVAPGSLIEEAALRREIVLVGNQKDVQRFAALTRQYSRRFKRSVYAENFRVQLRSTVKALGRTGGSKQLPEIEALAAQLETADQRSLYLSVARSAILQNKPVIAGFAAERAAGLARKGSPDAARANLYLGASMLLTDKYDAGVEALARVDSGRLAKRDGELFQAVTYVSKILRQPFKGPLPATAPPADGPPAAAATEKASEVIDRATQVLADADALLKSAPK